VQKKCKQKTIDYQMFSKPNKVNDCWENSKTEASKDTKGALRNKRVEAAAGQ
jgi:hypothetical protein